MRELPPAQGALIDARPGGNVARVDDALPPASLRLLTASALGCGVAGDILFDDGPQGVGLAIYLLIIAGGMTVAMRTPAMTAIGARTVPPQTRLLVCVAAIFAVLIALRDSEVLAAANTLAALCAIGLAAMVWPGSELNLFTVRMRDLVFAGFACGRDAVIGTPRFLSGDARRLFHSSRPRTAGSPVTGALGRALLIGISLTFVFGALLSAGDPVFRTAVSPLVQWDLPPLGAHLLGVIAFGWPVLGLLWAAGRRSMHSSAEGAEGADTPSIAQLAFEGLATRARVTLNRLDLLVALGLMNALFALFLLLQVRVLFGGQAYVTATTGLTMAEYARGGFFALTFTAAMVVGLLLSLDALLGSQRLADWHVSRRLSGALLALVGVVLCSATARMLLYVSTFGISVDRVVALAIIAWVAMVSAWFALTVLRGMPSRFVVGALCSAAFTLLTLNVVNMDAIVVRSGVSRVAAGRPLDVEYMSADLGADAVPTLVNAVVGGRVEVAPRPPGEARTEGAACTTAAMLLDRWGPATPTLAGAWTLGAWRARRSVRQHHGALASIACRPPVRPPAAQTSDLRSTAPIRLPSHR